MAKKLSTTIRELKQLTNFCKENKVEQLKLSDGTCIVLSSLAFYDELVAENGQKPNQSGEIPLDSGLSLDETIDEDLLFASARA